MSFISGRQVAMTRTTVRFGTTVRVMQCDERRSAAAASVLSERNAALLEDDQPAQPVESRARIATRDLLSDRSFPPQPANITRNSFLKKLPRSNSRAYFYLISLLRDERGGREIDRRREKAVEFGRVSSIPFHGE